MAYDPQCRDHRLRPYRHLYVEGLNDIALPLTITIFESDAEPGKGTPYHPDLNDRAMLSNIASIELPPICESLTAWLSRQSDERLSTLGVARDAIDEREFYPRVVLGDYLQDQLAQLIEKGRAKGHHIDIKASSRVVDIALHKSDISLTVQSQDGERTDYSFDHVVLATGHDFRRPPRSSPAISFRPGPRRCSRRYRPAKSAFSEPRSAASTR